MLRTLVALLSFVFVVSCNCQKLIKNDYQGTSNEKIVSLLGEKSFDLLQDTEMIIQYDIRKKLIEGTDNEYSNKVVFKDSLDSIQFKELLAKIANDDFYDWKTTFNKTLFEPTTQLLLKGKGKRLSLMFDEKSNILGFINLDGQNLVKLPPKSSSYIKKL